MFVWSTSSPCDSLNKDRVIRFVAGRGLLRWFSVMGVVFRLTHRFRGFNCWSFDLLVLVGCQSGTWWDKVIAKSLPFSISLAVRQEREEKVGYRTHGACPSGSTSSNYFSLLEFPPCPRGTFTC